PPWRWLLWLAERLRPLVRCRRANPVMLLPRALERPLPGCWRVMVSAKRPLPPALHWSPAARRGMGPWAPTAPHTRRPRRPLPPLQLLLPLMVASLRWRPGRQGPFWRNIQPVRWALAHACPWPLHKRHWMLVPCELWKHHRARTSQLWLRWLRSPGGRGHHKASTQRAPSWMKVEAKQDLDKELREIGDIEAVALRIRRGLQNMHEESQSTEVDVEAAALMMELRGTSSTGRRSSTAADLEAMALLAELHGDATPAWPGSDQEAPAVDSAVSSASHSGQPERPWHLEVLRLRNALGQIAKDTVQ
ncbi:unnamed protein product, partial [Symbiodinium pilosum]